MSQKLEQLARDEAFMARALALAERGTGWTSPNPLVGAVIVKDGRIIGESVINEMDRESRSANYRVCIFHAKECGRGIGTWMVKATRDFAFGDLRLPRLSLNVLSINPRAERVYRNAGFRREGVLRDAVRIDGAYADDILMAILEDEWHAIGK